MVYVKAIQKFSSAVILHPKSATYLWHMSEFVEENVKDGAFLLYFDQITPLCLCTK
jgi:hypothetical protein